MKLRTAVLIAGSSLAAAGWGAVLPYLYADVANARGLGGGTAAATFTAFALGSVIAAPAAGRLADRMNPARVAAVARVLMALTIVALAFAQTQWTIWAAALGYGATLAATQPSIQMILLAWTPERQRRAAFAWHFIALNLALAIGGFIGGFMVDLDSAAGVRPLYYVAAAASLASAVVVHLVGRGQKMTVVKDIEAGEEVGYRAILAMPTVRWLLIVTVLLSLACYAQYESGLPAYALDSLHIPAQVLGTAVALNAILVAVLTGPVVSATKRRRATSLLATCAAIWMFCWLLFGLPLLAHGSGSALIVLGYATISFGETMLAPVLNPLAASLAPEGAAGRTLASVTGAQTIATAVGPGLAGALIALHLPAGFIALQLACCLGAIYAARRLSVWMSPQPVHPAVGVGELSALDADELVMQLDGNHAGLAVADRP